MKDKRFIFEQMPIPKAVAKLAVPTVLSMLVTVVYNMADTYFVGQTGDPYQSSAVSLTTPVFFVLMALGNIFGLGGSSYISRVMGEGKSEKVKNISSFCFYGSLISGAVMIAVLLLCMPWILKVIGTSENSIGFSEDYLFWIAIGAPFVVASNAFGNIVRSEGAAVASMTGMMIGTIVNIILDPIMILTMDMGVAGAALATVIGNIAALAFYIIYILKSSSLLSVSLRDCRVGDGILKNVLLIGMPASINNLLMSAANIVMNNFLISYGDIPVAAMGIAHKANMLAVMLQLGISMGVQPLIGYNFGSKNYKRMTSTMKFSILCTVVVGGGITLAYYFASDSIIKIFMDNAEVIERGTPMLRALMLAGPVLGILFVFMSAFQAMGKALPSLLLSISRQGFVFIPFVFIGNRLFGLNGVIYAQPLADIVSIGIALLMFLFVVRKLKRKESVPEGT